MDLLVLGWLVLELTGSPFLVSLIGTFRLLPLGFTGFLFGSLGDRFPKHRILVAAQVVNTTATIGLATILLLGTTQLWHLYLTALVTGTAWAADFPVRRAFIRDMVPERSVINAVALDAASLTGMSMVGRFIGGGLLALSGAEGSYLFLSLCYVVGLVMLLRVSVKPSDVTDQPHHESLLKGIKEGLVYSWRTPIVRGVLLVTVFSNLLIAPYLQLTPVFAKDVLGVGPVLLGLMSGMDGMGSLLGSMVLATMGLKLRRLGAVFLAGTAVVSLGVLLFSASTIYLLSLAALFFAGVGLSGFVTMQIAIIVSTARPDMRGRAMGAITLAIAAMPLGMAYMGLLADRYGAPLAVGGNAVACLALLFAVVVFQPGLRRFRA
jgi:MFS family permease